MRLPWTRRGIPDSSQLILAQSRVSERIRPDLRETEEENEFEYDGDWGGRWRGRSNDPRVETKVRWFVVGRSPLVGRGTRAVTGEQIEAWIWALPLSARSKNNFRSRLGGLFNFAITRKYIDKGKNPVDDVKRLKVKVGKKPIFTVDEMRAVLTHANQEFLPMILIGAFAGVRTQERIRMTWEDIDIPRGVLTVGEEDSKTASRRTIMMEPCLQAWLLPFHGRTGPIFDGTLSIFVHQMVDTCKAAGMKKYPKNGLRHSFASYHVAKYDNAEKVRAAMGHSTARVLYESYREMVAQRKGTATSTFSRQQQQRTLSRWRRRVQHRIPPGKRWRDVHPDGTGGSRKGDQTQISPLALGVDERRAA